MAAPRTPQLPALRWRVPMTGRPVDEEHRVATPLELLFDLTFVVAVAQVAAELAHGIADDKVGDSLLGFVMVFFAIWWAWMNFTWFASAYDTDDVPYRLLTLVQMAGVLVFAAGIHDAFGSHLPAVVTDVGALPASVARTGAGWSVPAGSVDALADAITAALRDPEAWQRAADGARAVAIDQAPDRVGAALRAVYEVARTADRSA